MVEDELNTNLTYSRYIARVLCHGLIVIFGSLFGSMMAGANIHQVESLQIIPSQTGPTYDLENIANNAQDSKGYKTGVAILKIGYLLGVGQVSGGSGQCSGSGGLGGLCAIADLTNAIAVSVKTASDVAQAPGVIKGLNRLKDEIGVEKLDGNFSETLDSILNSSYIQNVLAAEIEHFVSSDLKIPTSDSSGSASHLLQVRITKVQSEGSFVNSRISVRLHGQAKLISTRNDQVLEDYHLSVETPELSMLEWSEGGATLLSEAFAVAIKQLSVILAEETLAIVTSPSMEKKGYLVGAQTPKNKICPFRCKVKAVKNYGFHATKSLTPTFRWQNFQEIYARDPLQVGEELSDEAISYEFRLYKATRLPSIANLYGANELILHVKDIDEPNYTLETELEPCTPYMWTVRTRFRDADRLFLTRWSGNYKEKDLDKWRIKIGNPTRMDNINLIGGALTGKQDQQIFYREGSYYFAFHTPAQTSKCRW